MAFDPKLVDFYFPEASDLMIEPMRIWQLPKDKDFMFQKICDSKEYFAQEKIDGAFYQYVRTANHNYLFGRTISVKNNLLTEKLANVPHIEGALRRLPPRTVIIGEVFIPGGESKDVTSIMGCLPDEAVHRQEDKKRLAHYYIHDIIYYDGVNLIKASAEDRNRILQVIWDKHELYKFSNCIHLAKRFDENIPQELNKILRNGGEGIVMRKKTAPYSPGKRPAWTTIKRKKSDTIDLVCIGFCDATRDYTGKDADTWCYWETPRGELKEGRRRSDAWEPVTKGYFYGWKTAMRIGAYDDNGQLVEIGTVSSGLTDEDRAAMAKEPDYYLDKVFTFSCMELDKKAHTLRHPILVERHPEKNPQECKISEIFS